MRTGQFSRTTHEYGQALSVVKPPDNNPGSIIPPELMDPALKLNQEQQRELADRIRDLYMIYKGEREFYT
jgi:hypothetical protein